MHVECRKRQVSVDLPLQSHTAEVVQLVGPGRVDELVGAQPDMAMHPHPHAHTDREGEGCGKGVGGVCVC